MNVQLAVTHALKSAPTLKAPIDAAVMPDTFWILTDSPAMVQ